MKPAKEFRTLIANEESLNALLEVKRHLEDYLPEENCQDKRIPGLSLARCALGHLGASCAKWRRQGDQSSTGGAERTVSENFSIELSGEFG